MTDAATHALLDDLWAGLGGDAAATGRVTFDGPARTLPSPFEVTALAAATIAVADLAVAELLAARTGGAVPAVTVDRRQAAVAFRSERHLRPIGWELPAIWDPIAGDYRCADGWIRLHTNYTYHRDAATAVLGVPAERDAVTHAVATWTGDELETAVVEAGGCAAFMRTRAQWRDHPQGRAVRREPVVGRRDGLAGSAPRWLDAGRARDAPLAGVRVLDLTRVIAGPVCTRVLAAHGADVLRIDPPGFVEVAALLGDTTAGKRCAALDLTAPSDRATFTELVAGADVLVHGYRSDALAALGFDTDTLWATNPGLVVTTHDAYGWSGPWSTRRGFDSLVQMSCGIAAHGQQVAGADVPVPLPAQALDHGTGYLLAAATCRALTDAAHGGPPVESRLSLARTAQILLDLGDDPAAAAGDLPADPAADADPWLEDATTAFGPVRRATCPGRIDGVTPAWTIDAGPLGTAAPRW